jgi:anticodon binding domain
MNDADLLGMPKQIITSEKNKERKQIEIKDRQTGISEILSIDEFKNMLINS